MSKQDPHQLYRLALLQQVRGEVRRYFPTDAMRPFFFCSRGFGGYGNEWLPIDTWDRAQPGRRARGAAWRSVLVVSLAYRRCTSVGGRLERVDSRRGVAHFVGLEAAVEAQENL